MPIAVAMSGGVDSAAAALDLQRRGEAIVGLTALLSSAPAGEVAAERAAEICRALDVPHHVLDLRADFDRLVVRPFLEDWAAGRTPNPCVGCNQHVKFGLLLDAARILGADTLATGHYARLVPDHAGHFALRRALDTGKDQSYVLHRLSQDQLRHACFMHGERSKAQVTDLYGSADLPVQPLSESQDICFLGQGAVAEILRERLPQAFRPGDVVSVSGETLGRHQGLAGHTVGQRKGLGIGGPGGRKFVLHVDVPRNRLVVGADADLWVSWCEVADVVLHEPGAVQGEDLLCETMIRYNGALTPSRVLLQQEGARIEFMRPARAPTPGQFAVFYQGDRCLGGGVIVRTELTDRYG